MKNGVILRGGYNGLAFPGNEDSRVLDATLTVLTGDLSDNDDDPMATDPKGDNAFIVVTAGNGGSIVVGDDTLLDYVTIRDGNGENIGGTSNGGAGITINAGSNPTIQNCIIEENSVPLGQDGGGILILTNDPDLEVPITNTIIRSNKANCGGGLAAIGSDVVLNDCTIENNTLADADNIGITLYGAGFYLDDASSGDFTLCTIRDNDWDADGFGTNIPNANGGGGASLGTLRMFRCTIEDNDLGGSEGNRARGGGIYVGGSSEIVRCVFDNNTVTNKIEYLGGGLYAGGGGHDIFNCRFINNMSGNAGSFEPSGGGGLCTAGTAFLANCLITHNNSFGDGGGVLDLSGSSLANCTLAFNTVTGSVGAGIYSDPSGTAATGVVNSIVYFNSATGGAGNVQDEQIAEALGAPTPLVFYSCIEDDVALDGTIPFGSANGNIDGVPVFADADGVDNVTATADDNYAPVLGSPVVDRGNTMSAAADAPDVDLDMDVMELAPDLVLVDRVLNGAVSGLAGGACIVDMGAFELPASALCASLPYGDMNQDGNWDGLDIQPFIDCYLTTPTEDQDCECALGDFGRNPGVELNDVPLFVQCILTGGVDCEPFFCSVGPRSGFDDCNNNGIPDDVDILTGCDPVTAPELCDCNDNDLPDGCDIDAVTSADLNNNDIADECEPDCNSNSIPDDKDIADGTSADCDSNGVPDECDEDCNGNSTPDACETLIDCNSNGIFDSCELDCDNDGVPDACELSGNDCNENEVPDDCEIDREPPFNLLDCDENGIPDVCQIDSGASQDCNSNTVPDECDIAGGYSDDTNSNGIPDECESQQQSQGGGGSSSMMVGGAQSLQAAPSAASWDTFHEWCFATDFSGMTASEKFAAIVDKQIELGIPVGQMFPN